MNRVGVAIQLWEIGQQRVFRRGKDSPAVKQSWFRLRDSISRITEECHRQVYSAVSIIAERPESPRMLQRFPYEPARKIASDLLPPEIRQVKFKITSRLWRGGVDGRVPGVPTVRETRFGMGGIVKKTEP